MTTIQWLGAPRTAGELGQVRLLSPQRRLTTPTAAQRRFVPLPVAPIPTQVFEETSLVPTLREPPGQWSFEILVGGRSQGTCGPTRMDLPSARVFAQNTVATIAYSPGTSIIGSGFYATPNCPDVLKRAREAYLRTRGAVTIAASRNGVFRFTYPAATREVAGVPEQGPGQLGVVPFQCWDTPGFKGCHAEQIERAKRDCTAAFIPETSLQDIEDCINALTDRYTEEECVQQLCPPEEISGVPYPWLQSSAATRDLQRDTNERIRAARAANNGYGLCDISVDGKLGPITCAAVDQVNPGALPLACQQRRAEWEGRPLGLCGPQGAVDCPEGQIRVGDKCATPAAPIVEPGTAPPAAATAGIGVGGVAALAALIVAGVLLVTQVT